METTELVKTYLASIKKEFYTGKATEHTYRAALKGFIEYLGKDIVAINEPKREICGAPDFIIRRGNLSVGYIETKIIGKSLDEVEDSDQLKRYRESLHNLILTDYLEFRWYVYGERRDLARIGRIGKNGKIIINQEGYTEVLDLLGNYLSQTIEKITTPIHLANQLARIAKIIRKMVLDSFKENMASNELVDLREAIARILIPEIGEPEKISEFADMYAQTIVYGLFAARCNHKESTPFLRSGAASEIPKTNPFLRKLFASIMGLGIEDEPHAPFIDDLVQILNSTDIDAVLSNFGKRSRQEDPVIHFYETFLKAYDPELRELRGVYYTPEPIVSYLVRSVDLILKNHFEISGGFLDTLTETKYKREKYFIDYLGRPEDHQLPRTVEVTCPRVLILDPACGTGTFLYNIIDYIRNDYMETMGAGYWSLFVREKLLKRIFGFELLMASYAIAHFKLGMQLSGRDLPEDQQDFWRYDFASNERLGIFLTNTLQEAENIWNTLFLRTISEEANEASVVKKDMPIMVVLGNPPYSGQSANSIWEIGKDGKMHLNFIGKLLKDYYKIDNRPLKERQAKWLQDDYVKFIRWAQWRIETTGAGIVGFVTNHSYIDNPTFRGMRQQLMKAFDEIYILDLHGNAKKGERSPDGSKDENVFDIQQGVAISLFIKTPKKAIKTKVFHADLWGMREGKNDTIGKYQWLNEHEINNTKWEQLEPQSPFYLFRPQNTDQLAEYSQMWSLKDIFIESNVGFVTARDKFAIDFDRDKLEQRISEFSNLDIPDQHFIDKYKLKDTTSWNLSKSRQLIASKTNWESDITLCLYRPFDKRYIFYSKLLLERPLFQIMQHLLNRDNLALITSRMTKGESFKHVQVSRNIAEVICMSPKTSNNGYIFPIYLYQTDNENVSRQIKLVRSNWSAGKNDRMPNLNPEFIRYLESHFNLRFISEGQGDLKSTFGPEDIFYYIYSILHSQRYRKIYEEYLKIDFPRIPITSKLDIFIKLNTIGKELVSMHLLESPIVSKTSIRYPVPGNHLVERGYPKFKVQDSKDIGKIFINEDQYFDDIPRDVWEYHVGGYQVCNKFLKDRRGRKLALDDVATFSKLINALRETIHLMKEIDHSIPEWPIR